MNKNISRVYEKLTSKSTDGKYFLSPIDLLIDVPFEVGCFKQKDGIDSLGTIVTDSPTNGMTPAWCLTKCLELNPQQRIAFIRDGNECSCFEDIPLAKLALDQDSCNVYCEGRLQDHYSCGAPDAYSVYVASKNLNKSIGLTYTNDVIIPACPDGWTRFADNCFKPLQSVQGDIFANADDCADTGGLLWYPESQSEITFVSSAFPAGSVGQYHLGVKSFQSTEGITFIDDSVNPGITFYTSDHFYFSKRNIIAINTFRWICIPQH